MYCTGYTPWGLRRILDSVPGLDKEITPINNLRNTVKYKMYDVKMCSLFPLCYTSGKEFKTISS